MSCLIFHKLRLYYVIANSMIRNFTICTIVHIVVSMLFRCLVWYKIVSMLNMMNNNLNVVGMTHIDFGRLVSLEVASCTTVFCLKFLTFKSANKSKIILCAFTFVNIKNSWFVPLFLLVMPMFVLDILYWELQYWKLPRASIFVSDILFFILLENLVCSAEILCCLCL